MNARLAILLCAVLTGGCSAGICDRPEKKEPTKFAGGEVKCQGLAKEYQIVAEEMECSYFDSSSVTTSSKVDGIHLDKDQHHTLGKALAGVVRELTE